MKSSRIWLALVVCLLTVTGVSGDSVQGASETTDDAYSIRLVKNLLQYPTQLGTGFGEKQANRLGDRVSIALLKILDEGDFANPQKVKALMRLMRAAFLDPKLIAIAEDRNPKVTMFLLKHLKDKTRDPRLKKEISDLIDDVTQKTAMWR